MEQRPFFNLVRAFLWGFALPCSFLFVGCGGKFDAMPSLDFTEVRFGGSNGAAAAAVNLMDFFGGTGLLDGGDATTQVVDGGIMVYATRINDGFFVGRRYLSSEGSTTWTLPNGAYHFHAVGFASADMTGAKYCGVANGDSGPGTAVSLNGNAKTVNLTLATGAASPCLLSPFQEYNAALYTDITVIRCSGPAPLSSACPRAAGSFSLKFAIFQRDEFFGPRSFNYGDVSMVAGCIDGPSSGTTAPEVFAVPLGDLAQANRFSSRSEILFYPGGTGCPGALRRLMFPFGLAAAGRLNGRTTFFIDDVPSPDNALMTLSETAHPVLYIYVP